MSGQIKYLDDANFTQEVAAGVTLVDFYADWCGPCRTIAPVIEKLAAVFSGEASIAKVDIDNAQGVASSLGITSIPTLILFKDGKEVERIVGVRDQQTLESLVRGVL